MSFAIFSSSCINQEPFIPHYNLSQQQQQQYQQQQRCSSFQLHSQYESNYSYNGNQQQNRYTSTYPMCGNGYQVQRQWQPSHTRASLNSNFTSNLQLCPNVQKGTNNNNSHNNSHNNSPNINKNCGKKKSNLKLDKKIKMKKTNNSEPKKDTQSFKQKYKTEICHYWQVNGYCRFGDECAFAHGNLQLKQKTHVPNNYKTQICKQFRQKMYCPYGARCQYLHESQSVLRGELPYTSTLRMNFQHLATRLQAQATAEDEDIFKTLMQKGAKFKNFYPRERLPIFKQICQMGKIKKDQQYQQHSSVSTSFQLTNNNLVYTNNIVQQQTTTKEEEEEEVEIEKNTIEKNIERKLSLGSEVISQGTAADSEEDDSNDYHIKRAKCIHSDGDDDDDDDDDSDEIEYQIIIV